MYLHVNDFFHALKQIRNSKPILQIIQSIYNRQPILYYKSN